MWPQEFIELKHIEDLLVCGICYDVMDTSVITSCSHSYCSLCIRKYLHYKTQCPACFAETFERDLRKNKVLDEIIAQFLCIKDKLKRCLEIQIQFAQGKRIEENCKTPRSGHLTRDASANKCESMPTNSVCTHEKNESTFTSVQNDVSSPSTSGTPKIPLMFTPKRNKRENVENAEKVKVVMCPICAVDVSEVHINKHLDDCLKRESQKDRPHLENSKRKPLPKLVFSLMKDGVIRKKLKEFGLSSHGDRKTLEARLQRYIIVYNAECDKLHPRPVSELIKQCEDEENIERKCGKASLANKLQVNRNTEQNIIEDQRKKYLEANKNSFETLIRQIKGIEKPTVRRSLLKESMENNGGVGRRCEAVVDKLEESLSELDDLQPLNSGVYIQDSDSDTSCPLQMYSSNDPIKFLNVDLLSTSHESRNKTENEMHFEADVDEQKCKTSYSPLQANEVEDYDNSVGRDAISVSNKDIQSVLGNSICQSPPKSSSGSPRYKMLLRRNREMNRSESATPSTKVFDCDSTLDEKGEEEKESTPHLQHIPPHCAINVNPNTEFKHGKTRFTDHVPPSNGLIVSPNLEKENISCPSRSNGNSCLRKRSHNAIQNDNKHASANTIKRKKKSSEYLSIEAKESSVENSEYSLNDKGVENLQRKPRLRTRLTSSVEDTAALRKSTRIKSGKHNG